MDKYASSTYFQVSLCTNYSTVQDTRKTLPLAEVECGLGLCLVERSRGAADDYCGPCVTTEGFLEDSRQLGVSVRDVCFAAVCES